MRAGKSKVTIVLGMPEPIESLGIIAGSRSLPFEIARAARRGGVVRIIGAAFEGETDPALADLVDQIAWLRVGQLSRLIAFFKQQRVRHCVMAGQIAPRNLFDLRPDWRAATLLFRLKEKNAHTIFGAIAAELRKEGIELIEATPWLGSVMPPAGFRLGKRPTQVQEEDVRFGYKIAKEISRLEIGQCVVVKNGTVLAVEGFEGTDGCLARGGALAGKEGGGVAVKVAKENHDMRFDIPCVGEQTVRMGASAGIAVLALEAGRVILLDRERITPQLAKGRMALVTVGGDLPGC